MADRDDFLEKVKRTLADRVGNRCSYPGCRALTSGPHSEANKRVSVGVAAHITAASPSGPRYSQDLTPEERASADNGIWMCSTHGAMVDRDEERYTVAKLRKWKQEAETEADEAIGKTVWPEDKQDLEEPDVTLLFSWEKYASGTGRPVPAAGFTPPSFEVKNFGFAHASEVRIDDFVGGTLVARFPLIADLGPGESITRNAEIKDPSTRTSALFDQLNLKNIEDLLESADSDREHRRLQQIGAETGLTEQQMDDVVDELAKPFNIEMRLTYWNREHTRHWEKLERLCYEPHDHRAYMLHGARSEIT